MYDLQTRRLCHSEYLKQRQNSLLLFTDPIVSKEPDAEVHDAGQSASDGVTADGVKESNNNDDVNDIWEKLDAIESSSDKKRSRKKIKELTATATRDYSSLLAEPANPVKKKKSSTKMKNDSNDVAVSSFLNAVADAASLNVGKVPNKRGNEDGVHLASKKKKGGK